MSGEIGDGSRTANMEGIEEELRQMGVPSIHRYVTILDERRLGDELAEARRILNHWRLKFTSGNPNPVSSRHIVAEDIDVRDTFAFFEKWPAP